jgi:hypothetical protein
VIVASIGIDFNDKTQPAVFEITFDENPSPTSLSISCHVGELIEQRFLNEQEFNQNLGKIKLKASWKFFNYHSSSSSWNE